MIDMHHSPLSRQLAGKGAVGLINIACAQEMKNVQPDTALKHDHTGHSAVFE